MRRLLAAALLLAAPGAFADSGGREKLNFVFILADDYGWADTGFNNPKTFYETPNLDALARSGMVFRSAYAAGPVCSPTRASIVTGKHPARLGLTDWIPGRGNRPDQKLSAPKIPGFLPLEEVTFAEALKEHGYDTFFAGKWHLGGPEYQPEKQGFDINKGGHHRGSPPGGYFSPYKNPMLEDGPKGEYLTDRLGSETVRFIEEHRERPFLAYLSTYTVHIPLQGKPELVEKYRKKLESMPKPEGPEFLPEGKNRCRQVQNHPVYAAMVRSLDENVGRILKRLDELGIAGRTAVIFMSDNGGLSTAEGHSTSNLPLRAGKGWLYEGGLREPMVIRWPGVTKPGGVCDVPVTSTDFYPTMLEMAGLPLKPGQHADGVSLVPLLRGTGSIDRKAVFWHYPHYSNQGGRPGAAVRAGDFKLIEYFEDGGVELFNLREDIGERKDLSGAQPDRVGELRAMLRDWLKSVEARMMSPNPGFKGP